MATTIKKYIPSKQTLKERATSVKAWELPKQTSALAPDYVWTNADMDPVPLKDQTWTMLTWVLYWLADVINIGTWETASSIIAVGLTWREALPIMVVGTTCVAIPMVLNGAIGAKLHVPFSVVIRSSFGSYFAYFAIVSRAILAMFWLGIQGANGAICITIMIAAIWPSYESIPNQLPSNGGITSEGMVSYFLFWLIQLPLLLIPPTKLQYLFYVKMIAAPIAAIAMMGWCVHQAGGSGALFHQKASVSGSAYVWKWLSCMSAVTGSWSTLACNIPDFSRYAKSSRGQYVQLPFLPFVFTVCGTLGIITTSASIVIFGEALWNPLDIVHHWLAYGPHGRAAAFFSALAWYIAQVGTNITANSISAANDLTVLFPRYVNIARGCMIAAVVGGWVIVPWKIIASATTFLNFMGGYAVFLAPIAGILASDYWLVKRQHIDVPALYDPFGRYHYYKGTNWRALLAMLLAVGPNLPGLAYSINPHGTFVNQGIKNLYTFDWLYGFTVSIVVYTLASYLFPAPESLVAKTIYGLDAYEGEDVASDDIERTGGKGYDGVAAVVVGANPDSSTEKI